MRAARNSQARSVADDRLEVGADHLDHHVLAALQLRGMHLGDRGRGQRLHVEAGEDVAEPGAQLLLDARHGAARRSKGGTWSCRRASSSAMSGGSRSRRVESSWPNLMKIGPRSSRARRSAFATAQFQLLPRQPAPGQGEAQGAHPGGQRQGQQQVVQAVADAPRAGCAAGGGWRAGSCSRARLLARRSMRASRRSRASLRSSSSSKRA